MFARINSIVQKVKGVKDTVSDLGTQGKDLLDKTKAAYQDVTQDGLGMDDLAKIGGHVQDIAKGAGEAVMQAKDSISNIVSKKQETTEQEFTTTNTPKKTTKPGNKTATSSTAKKSTAPAAKKTTKSKAAA
ncbi:MAG: hypothetical protein WC004_02440 [Candidatus Absconditabacterales bacterium]